MIQAFRISFLFTRTYLGVFDKNTKCTYPVREYFEYLQVFEDLKNNKNIAGYPWKYPWENKLVGNFFWWCSLQGTDNDFSATPSDRSAKIFEKYVAAFFYKMDYSLEFESDTFEKPIVVNLQLYAYQHGLGLIINPFIPKAESDKIENIIEKLRYENGYTLKCDLLTEDYNGKNLEDISDILFSFIKDKYLLGDCNKIPKEDPFSIITIVSDGEESDVQKAESFSLKIDNILSGKIKTTIAELTAGQNSRVDMFASTRSRIIWSGLNVQEPFRIKSKLIMNHYHNNISKLSLQIKSLGDLLLHYRLKGNLWV